MSRRPESRPKPGGKRERTRAALVAATLEIVESRGFAAASLDEIAAKAGMTKGAIYSNFATKGELLLAAMTAKGLTLSSPRPAATTVGEELSAMARDLAATLKRAQGEASFLGEFQVYALTDAELRKVLAATYSDAFARTAAYLAGLKDMTAAMQPRELAVALQAVALGFMMQSLITPDEITDAVIAKTMRALAEGLTAS